MYQEMHQTGLIPIILIICFLAQALKEGGIPTFGLMHSIMLYAGFKIALGDIFLGTSIVLTALLASLAGAFFVYHIARSKGSKGVKYLPVLDSAQYKKASKVLSRCSFPAVTLGRLLPGMMLPVSLVAGMMHFPLLSFMAGVFVQLCLWVLCFLVLGNTAGQIIPVPVFDSPTLIDRGFPALLICGSIAVIVYLVIKKRSFHTESSLTPR